MPRSFYSVMGKDKQKEMRQEFSRLFPNATDEKIHEALQEGDPLVEFEKEGGDYRIWEDNMKSLKQRLKQSKRDFLAFCFGLEQRPNSCRYIKTRTIQFPDVPQYSRKMICSCT